ncbi:MAG TPA: tyrosine-type recombinase/integrase [Thermoanaerobaculia bacterium]|nr:tyrosine-type recombinase/integrase [Thermoanaerobaculia bacterium]
MAGVSGYPHRFRHTLATELLSEGVSVEIVAAILGHSPRITLKTTRRGFRADKRSWRRASRAFGKQRRS